MRFFSVVKQLEGINVIEKSATISIKMEETLAIKIDPLIISVLSSVL